MWFESMLVPNTPHGGRAETDRFGHRTRGPVGRLFRLFPRGFVDNLPYLRGRDFGRTTWSRSIFLQPSYAEIEESVAPTRHFVRRNIQGRRDLSILFTGSRQQDNPSTLHDARRPRARSGAF